MTDDLNKHLSTDRKDFNKGELDESTLEKDPFKLFKKWLQEALDKMAIEPYAFHLSTSVNNKPTSRVVYLRTVEEDGYVFFTNYHGRKGQEIEKNNQVGMNFFWAEKERQVRIEGKAYKIEEEASDAYFSSRPRKSQLGAWASYQSEALESYQELEDRLAYYEEKFKDQEVLRPKHWGGYIIKPTYFEFWQGRPNRLHDRIVFEWKNNTWTIKRINP